MATMSGVSSSNHLAIKNILSRYCQALDSKDFDLLKDVFLHDVVADYPFNSDLQGVEAISKAIQNRYVYR
jgi:predicted xylose isomerase-like sugar epimerase